MGAVKPILFSGPMVRAILDGRKSQTRRVLKPQPTASGAKWHPDFEGGKFLSLHCPTREKANIPYAPGVLLWVREACHTYHWDKPRCVYRADSGDGPVRIRKQIEAYTIGKWTPSIHMPRWASRLTLEVTDVRVQRLQEISEADARAEGCNPYIPGEGIVEPPRHPDDHQYRPNYKLGFGLLWDSLNAKRGFGWETNPWVAAISFRPIHQNIGAYLAERENPIPRVGENRPGGTGSVADPSRSDGS